MKAAGLFETILVRDRRPAYLDEHLHRLRRSAEALGVPGFPGAAPLRERCLSVAGGHRPPLGRMRVALERGFSTVTVEPFPGYPAGIYETGAVALLAPAEGHPLAGQAGHKVLPYDVMIDSRDAAEAAGAFEVLFRDRDGSILEGSVSNFFAEIDGTLLTPPLRSGILPGVTRFAVIRAAEAMGLEVREERLREHDLIAAGEAFLTSSLMEVVPLHRVGEVALRTGPIADAMLGAVRREP